MVSSCKWHQFRTSVVAVQLFPFPPLSAILHKADGGLAIRSLHDEAAYDIVIRNGRVKPPRCIRGRRRIAGETVAAIGPRHAGGRREIDARGKLGCFFFFFFFVFVFFFFFVFMPGGVDSHAHIEKLSGLRASESIRRDCQRIGSFRRPPHRDPVQPPSIVGMALPQWWGLSCGSRKRAR